MYRPRIVGIQVMMQDDFDRLHKYMLEIELVDAISGPLSSRNGQSLPKLRRKSATEIELGSV